MDLLDELRTRYRRLKTRHLKATAVHRVERAKVFLEQAQTALREQGFEVAVTADSLRAAQATRTLLLRADSDEEIRIGEFLGFTFTCSQLRHQRTRIIAQLKPDDLAENAPMDVNTAESIQAQIAYMERLLESGAPAVLGFEVRRTMTMENYREPQSGHERRVFASLEEALVHLLTHPESA